LYEEGRNAVYQKKNGALVIYTPKKSNTCNIKSFRIDIICNYYSEFDELYVNNNKITHFPLDFTYEDKIFVSDYNTYFAIIPVCGSEITYYSRAGLKNKIWIKDNFIIFSLYSYNNIEKSFSEEEIKKLINGFVFEVGEKRDYNSFSDFRKHIYYCSLNIIENERIFELNFSSNNKNIFLSYDPRSDAVIKKGTDEGEDILYNSYYESDDINIQKLINDSDLLK
jgi:hypothetical protein